MTNIRSIDASAIQVVATAHDLTTAAVIDDFKKGARVVMNYDGARTDPLIYVGTITKKSVADRTVRVRFDDGESADFSATRKWILGLATNKRVRKNAIPVKELPKWLSEDDVALYLNRTNPKPKKEQKVVVPKETLTPTLPPTGKGGVSSKTKTVNEPVKVARLDKVVKGKYAKMSKEQAVKEYTKVYRSVYNKQIELYYIEKFLPKDNTSALKKEIADLQPELQELEKAVGDLAVTSKIRRDILVNEHDERKTRLDAKYAVAIQQWKPSYL